jgi:F0F1-type ATP synthase membrane subunit b/b'
MAESPQTNPQNLGEVQARLHEVAEVLRHADRLEPEAQDALADLVDELSKLLTAANVPVTEATHLASEAANLARALQQPENRTLLAAARRRLEAAAIRAEEGAPLASGFVQRLLDTLANLGI